MNKCWFIGNAVKAPEKTTTASGVDVCRFTIAVNRKYKNDKGETECDFINCVAWRGTADIVYKYVGKGNKVGIVGSLQTRSYDAQDGTKKYATEIIVDEVELLTSKSDSKAKDEPSNEGTHKFEPIDDSDLPF